MTSSEDKDTAALAAATSLEAAMRGLSDDLGTLRTYGKRNRLLIWVVGGVVALLILVGAVLWHTTAKADDAANEAKRATSAASQSLLTQHASCEAGNETRQVSRQLWNYVLDSPAAKPDATAADKQKIKEFRQYVNTTFAPRDCAKIGVR